MKFLLAVSFLVLFAFADAPLAYPYSQDLDSEIQADSFQKNLLIYAIFEATNRVRIEHGQNALQADSVLDLAAQYQADRMFMENKLQHRWRRDRQFGQMQNRINHYGGGFKYMGENIARHFILNVKSGEFYYLNDAGHAVDKKDRLIPNKTYRELANEVVDGSLNSPPHRKNLLGDFDYLGLGVSSLRPLKKGLNFDVYLCQNFGTK